MNKEQRSAYHKTWYALNKEKVKAKARKFTAEARRRNYEYVDELKSNPCADCGGTFDPICMDFDHVLGTKISSVSNLCKDAKSIAVIQSEIDKCDLVCANCHRIRTRDR